MGRSIIIQKASNRLEYPVGQKLANWMIRRNGEHHPDEATHAGFIAPDGRLAARGLTHASWGKGKVDQTHPVAAMQAMDAMDVPYPESWRIGYPQTMPTALSHGLVRYRQHPEMGLHVQADVPMTQYQKAAILRMHRATSGPFFGDGLGRRYEGQSSPRAFFETTDQIEPAGEVIKAIIIFKASVSDPTAPECSGMPMWGDTTMPLKKAFSGEEEAASHPMLAASGFYSNLERVVQKKMPNFAPGQQVKGIINGISPEEIYYSGIAPHLEGNKVAKSDVLATIRQNTPEITENKLTGGKTEYKDWSTPGLTGYTEHLLHTPSTTPGYGYESPHWQYGDVLAHIRYGKAKDEQGNKVTHLDEIQSDWHQAGRKHGYMDFETAAENGRLQGIHDPAYRSLMDMENQAKRDHLRINHSAGDSDEAYSALTGQSRYAGEFAPPNAQNPAVLGRYGITPEQIQEAQRLHQIIRDNPPVQGTKDLIPDAPFKKKWHELALKKAVIEAVKHGSKRITWTTGDTQNNRYGLHHHIDEIRHRRFGVSGDPDDPKFSILALKNGVRQLHKEGLTANELREHLGDDITRQITASPEGRDSLGHWGSIPVTAQTIGGEGMRGFYDNILPKYAQKLAGQYGGEVGMTNLIAKGKPIDPEDVHLDIANGRRSFEADMAQRATYGGYPDSTRDEYLRHVARYNTDRDPVHIHNYLRGFGYIRSDRKPVAEETQMPVHYMDITPAMRSEVQRNGLPLWGESDASLRKAVDDGGPEEMYSHEGASPVRKFHGIVSRITHLPPTMLKPMNGREVGVGDLDDATAQNMKYDEPVHVSAFSDGELRISDGHHRVAAAVQTGKPSIRVHFQAINTRAEHLNRLIALSDRLRQVEEAGNV